MARICHSHGMTRAWMRYATWHTWWFDLAKCEWATACDMTLCVCHFTHARVMSHKRVMAHKWSDVTHWICPTYKCESVRSTYEWVTHHGANGINEKNKSWHAYEWVMARICISHGTHMNESLHAYEWVMTHMRMRDGTHVHEFCVMAHVQ